MKQKIPVKREMINILFIRKSFPVMTWSELLDAVNETRPAFGQVELSALRHQVRRMGLKKGIRIRRSPGDVDFLLSGYTKMGNVETETNELYLFRIASWMDLF